MSDRDERGSQPRPMTKARILWSVVGSDDLQMDRLREVSPAGARVPTLQPADPGAEIRFDLLDDAGEKMATGLARVATVDASGAMRIDFLSLGVDPAVIAALHSVASIAPPPPSAASGGLGPDSAQPSSRRRAPPPLPGEPPLFSQGAGPVSGRVPPPLPPEPPSSRRQEPPPIAFEPLFDEAVAQPAEALEVLPDPFAHGLELEEVGPEIEPLSVPKAGVIIGIDLGTTNTCAAYVKDGRPVIIPGRTGTSTIPSMITFDPDGRWHVGQRAADRQILHPLRTVYGSKRLVGRTYRAELAAELQQHFAYPLGEAEGQRFGARIDGRVISMDTIAARVLDEVRSTAEAHLGCQVEAAVITVPAYFSEVQREAVRRAAKEASLVVHRIVNEPTAAAVAYGHKRQGSRARVAVWDFGGGTFDFSIVEVDGDQLEVLATGGDNFVGGSDFDDLLASHLLAEFQALAGLSFEPEPQQIARLREAAELAKRALSVETEHLVELPEFTKQPKRALSIEVTREQFEELSRPLIERTLTIASEVMEARGLSPRDIDDVLLVGGTTRIPAVQQAVGELFGKRPSKRINPDEAVALGAALLADEIGSSSSPVLLDILPMTVGYGVPGLRFVPVVARNSRLPAQQEIELDADLLGSVTLPLFQGESLDASRNEYLCTAIIEDRSLWDKGRVKLTLSFDEHCVMAVDAQNARTRRPLPIRLDRTRAIDDVLRELGTYKGPTREETWQLPPSRLGKALGKLFSLFGR